MNTRQLQAIDVFVDMNTQDSLRNGGMKTCAYLPADVAETLCTILGVRRVRNISISFGVSGPADGVLLDKWQCRNLVDICRRAKWEDESWQTT